MAVVESKFTPLHFPSISCEDISMMSQPLLRLIVAYAMGVFFLVESFNPNFWRANIATWNPIVHVFIAMFGVACIIQAVVIHRQLRSQKG